MDHGGHRERLKQRFLQEGLEGFGDARALELLLFYAIPRKDTYPIAKALLDHFGSLVEVMEASPDALTQVPGVGEGAANLIYYINALSRYYFVRRSEQRKALNTVEQCAEFLAPRFFGLREEIVCALCLDAQCRCLGCKVLGEGSVNSANVPIRRIVEFSLACNATSVVLSHNHPAGIALPSGQDIEATRKVDKALEAVGIILADHLIFTAGDYTSMAESGVLKGIGK